jgi:hypothetical protein
MKAHEITPAEIAARAYEIYQWRGATDGHDLEDWLEAERELTQNGNAEEEPPAEEEIRALLPERRQRVTSRAR